MLKFKVFEKINKCETKCKVKSGKIATYYITISEETHPENLKNGNLYLKINRYHNYRSKFIIWCGLTNITSVNKMSNSINLAIIWKF